MNERLRRLPTYPMVRLEERKAELRARGVEVLDFGTGDPREPTPAFIRQAFVAGVPEVSQYPAVAGLPEMRRAAAAWVRERFGVDLDADAEVLPTRGSKEAVFNLPLVLVDPQSARDTVVYGVPAYPVFEIGALFAGARTHEALLTPENRYLLEPEAVPEEVLARTALVFLNYPHNPSGQEMPAELLERWVRCRAEHGFVLASDECYADVYFGPAPPRSVLEFGRDGCLALHSLSKRSGMTGYRSGFVAGDRELVALYRRFRSGMGVAPEVPAQRAAAAAWADARHAEERRAVFARKRDLLLGHLERAGLRAYPGTATLFLWVEAPAGHTGESYAEALLERGIVVTSGPAFGPGQERFFRVALVPSLEQCEEAIARWP